MTPLNKPATILTNQVSIRPEFKDEFADWQAKLNGIMAAFPGFVSLEILSPDNKSQTRWSFVQRFHDADALSNWKNSNERKALMEELKPFVLEENPELETAPSAHPENVTEIFVTLVSPDKEEAYREWMAKIHQAEVKFPGFKGVYVQSSINKQGRNWITLLQFDTPENLDRWLNSPERMEVLKEAKSLIATLESHRVISPYAGWFASVAKEGALPPIWKQTMLVLLVLFPIVVLELKFLSPLLIHLNNSLATFIGNAISVTLISWPCMPLAIGCLGWWLSPKDTFKTTFLGTLLVLALYLFEICLFWFFL